MTETTPLSGKNTLSRELSASMRICSRSQRICSSSGKSCLRLRDGRASKRRLRGQFDKGLMLSLNDVRLAPVPIGKRLPNPYHLRIATAGTCRPQKIDCQQRVASSQLDESSQRTGQVFDSVGEEGGRQEVVEYRTPKRGGNRKAAS